MQEDSRASSSDRKTSGDTPFDKPVLRRNSQRGRRQGTDYLRQGYVPESHNEFGVDILLHHANHSPKASGDCKDMLQSQTQTCENEKERHAPSNDESNFEQTIRMRVGQHRTRNRHDTDEARQGQLFEDAHPVCANDPQEVEVPASKNPPLTVQDLATAELKEAQDNQGQIVLQLSIDSDKGKKISSEVFQPPFQETWESKKLIGRGRFGEVQEVLTDKDIRCAAKTIKVPVQIGVMEDAPDARKRITEIVMSEINLCKLQHKNIARFLYIKQLEDYSVVIFMELLSGVTLEQRLGNKPLPEEIIGKYAVEICSALSYMHSMEPKIIHRDINCTNIIVIDDEQLKLIDFGLSIQLMSGTHHSSSAVHPKGTWNFMAPELLDSESERIIYSRESDIWAFGCTVYQMATGNVPHSDCNILKLAMKLKTDGAPQMPVDCSNALKSFYSCCVARNRKERKSAYDLLKHEFLSAH